MTVWTPVSLDEANAWLKARSLAPAAAITPIEEGVEDSVFRLTFADTRRACLRLFERTEAQGPLQIAQCLARQGLPTCPPLEDARGRLLWPLKEKPAALFPWIEGTWIPVPSLAQIEEMGFFLGNMALKGPAHCANWKRENPRGRKWFKETTARLLPVLEKETGLELKEEMQAQRAFWQSPLAAKLPRGPIHADLFRNNVLYHPDGTLGAVIDWGFCASDEPLLYDLAIVANDWCLKTDSFELDETKSRTLRRAREKLCPLTPEEKEAWPMLLRFAALRFYLSRLQDATLPRNPSGKALDPAPFLGILRARQKNDLTKRLDASP